MKYTLKQIARFLCIEYETLAKQVRNGGAGAQYMNIGATNILQFNEVETVGIFAMHLTIRHLRDPKLSVFYAERAREFAALPPEEMKRWSCNFWLWNSNGKKQESCQMEGSPPGKKAKTGIEYQRGSYCLIRYPVWILVEMVDELRKQVDRELKEKAAAKQAKKEPAPARSA